MALSPRQKILVIEMLGLLNADHMYRVDQLSLNSVLFATYTGLTSGRQIVLNEIQAMDSNDSDKSSYVQELIAGYEAAKASRGVSMNGGGVGEINGMTIDFAAQMDSFKRDLIVQLPIVHELNQIAAGNNGTVVNSCTVLC